MSWWGRGRNLPQTHRTMHQDHLVDLRVMSSSISPPQTPPCRLNVCFYNVDILSCGRTSLLCLCLSLCVRITFRHSDMKGSLCWRASETTHPVGKGCSPPRTPSFLAFSVFDTKYHATPLKKSPRDHIHLYQFHNYRLTFFIRNLSQKRSICRFLCRNSYEWFAFVGGGCALFLISSP